MSQFYKIKITKIIKTITKNLLDFKAGRFLIEIISSENMTKTKSVFHDNVKLIFTVPNSLNNFRVETFSTKEPETLKWIDEIPEKSVFWDIGANIGLYTCYAAKSKNCKVYAFEPSVFNLELLSRNIFLNNLSNNVVIIPIPLSDKLSESKMKFTTTSWGGALSTFGKEFGWDGKNINEIFEFRTIGLSIDEVVNKLNIAKPDYIKMDVDGIEHFILQGGSEILKYVKSILIEINDDFIDQSNDCTKILKSAGLTLVHKLHSEMTANSNAGFGNSYNQIWTRLND
jgi:FkbM family methyltransferase